MIQDDFTLDYTAKTISHNVGLTTRYTVNALYSWLMDLFDDAGQMDDQVPMYADTPVEYKLINGWSFGADSDLGYLYGGSIVDTTNSDVWANFYTLGTIASGAIVYWQQGSSLVATHPGYVDGHIDQLIKVVDGGVATDDRKITAYIRNLGDLYDHFQVAVPATGGRNPVPLASATDSNDNELGGSVTGVTVSFGTVAKDIGDGLGAVNYDLVIDGGGNAIVDVYRRLKYLARRENTTAIDSPENLTEGRFYQAANAAYAQVKAAPFGSFAGGKFFGARGVWVENISDPNNRELIDAAGTSHIPPVSITVSVSGVLSGDRVLVARSLATKEFTISATGLDSITVSEGIGSDIADSGTLTVGSNIYSYTGVSFATFEGVTPDPSGEVGALAAPYAAPQINKAQFTISSVTASTIVATTAIPSDVPTTGTIRVGDTQFAYTGVSGSTFTGVTPDPTGQSGVFFAPLIDTVAAGSSVTSGSMIYSSDFSVVGRVRKKGILPFENSGTVTSAGLTISAIRTTDGIVTVL